MTQDESIELIKEKLYFVDLVKLVRANKTDIEYLYPDHTCKIKLLVEKCDVMTSCHLTNDILLILFDISGLLVTLCHIPEKKKRVSLLLKQFTTITPSNSFQ